MAWNYSNTSVETTLTNTISAIETSIVVGSVSGFPVSYPYTLVLDHGEATREVVNVTAGVGTTLTVTRGQDGTAASGHNAGVTVVHAAVARDLQEPQDHIAASTNVHGLAGGAAVVGTTSTQTLTNKTLTSPTVNSGATVSGTTAVTVATADTDVITSKASGDAVNRFYIEGQGLHAWGDGTNAADTNLYRNAANELKTDDALTVVGAFTSPGYRYSETVYFTSSGSFTKASYPGLRMVVVEALGGGGGGGGSALTAAGQAAVGAGGGSGGYGRKQVLAGSLAASETVTIGAAGAASSAGNSNGGNGGNSSFGAHCTANGGGGGEGDSATATAVVTQGGDGGTATGDLAITGGDGGNGLKFAGIVHQQGAGAGSMFGGAQRPSAANSAGGGTAAAVYGSGGSGAFNQASQGSDLAGGAGSAGIVIVHVYL